MIKYISATIIFILSWCSSSAQVWLGLEAGLSGNFVKTDLSQLKYTSSKPTPGLQIGLQMRYPIGTVQNNCVQASLLV
jgi:hypothetical protein